MRRGGAQGGFTIIEMMMVVLIASVLSAFALPAMRDIVRTNRMKSLSLDLYTSLTLARSEAIKRNTGSVSMIAATGGWQNGWTVTCVDTANSCGGANVVVIAADAVDSTLTLTGPAGNIVTFKRDGRLATAAASFKITAGSDYAGAPMRCVDVNTNGRAVTRADTNHTDLDGCN